MKILAFDTCWQACSAVVVDADGPSRVTVRAHRYAPMLTGQAEVLPVMLRDVLAEAGCVAQDIDRIAVPFGPGSFTGVRISVAAARAVHLSTGADVVTCSSLAVVAAGVRLAPERLPLQRGPMGHDLLVAMDARRGEVYAQRFGSQPNWKTHAEPQLLPVTEAAKLCQTPTFDVIGTAADAIVAEVAHQGGKANALLNDGRPDALYLAQLAPQLEPMTKPLMPVYIRPPDAKPSTKSPIRRVSEHGG